MNNLKNELERMRDELESSGLEVVLAPQKRRTNEGGCIRVVVSKNPPWYRKLCESYSKNRTKPRKRRKHDTAIKRSHTFRALEFLTELASNKNNYESVSNALQEKHIYARRILEIANLRLKCGHK